MTVRRWVRSSSGGRPRSGPSFITTVSTPTWLTTSFRKRGWPYSEVLPGSDNPSTSGHGCSPSPDEQRRIGYDAGIGVHRDRSTDRDHDQPVVAEFSDEVVDRHVLLSLLDDLAERDRHAVSLHYLLDFSVTDTAQILDVAEGTVKSRLARARRLLHEAGDGTQQREEHS